ncbi:hypothetical protein D9615_001504 [Tricholomella constricta]|uniref:GST N-terminal domain-containing protein n=1 Tax=Tricholomella constricta TaxID=117010 RepID=A0A8H5HLP7_9AGAR|nr:hypothetical protein D9615_001504 [Tricholomella constricta]
MSSGIPKAVLYYSPVSVWSAAVLLTLEEKGYGADEIDRKQVDLTIGENYDPTFLRLNPKATVPTLVVPMQKTLTEDVESRYKALTETQPIIEFLDKSRSTISRTHTTSTAPAPALAPATIAFASKTKTIIDVIHSEDANPNHLAYTNARDDTALRTLASETLPALTGKQKSLARYITDAEQEKIHVSEKTKAFWRDKKAAVDVLLEVVENADKSEAELDTDAQAKRAEFYTEARHAWGVALKDVLIKVDNEHVGPYTLGDQFSIADLHLASWLARLVRLAGGAYVDDGDTAIGKLEAHIGGSFALAKDFPVEDAQGMAIYHIIIIVSNVDGGGGKLGCDGRDRKTSITSETSTMAFAVSMLRPPANNSRRSTMVDDYDSASSTDSDRIHARTRVQPTASGSSSAPHPSFLFAPHLQSGRSSVSSTAASSPLPSRSNSPLPQFYSSNPSSSCTSDTDSEPVSHLLRNRNHWWRENRRSWWSVSRRRRKRDGRIVRFLKKWTRRIVRHPFFPSQPITIVLTLILLSIFAIFLTLLLIYILNPDKEPLPWRAYCSNPSLSAQYDAFPLTDHSSESSSSTNPPPFPPTNLDTLSPAGLFVGVFSIDSSFERRMFVRTTWATHPRSRDGAGEGDDGVGTSRTIVRFILGQPRKDWERRIKLEMETYNDIIILPITENMNSGKTHTFFSWAAINAWVPPVYSNSTISPPLFSYSNHTASPPSLAPHDSYLTWQDQHLGTAMSWVRPDFVVKVDDDSFVMLAELEARLRVELHAQPRSNHESTPPFSSILSTETSSATGNTSTEGLTLTAQDMQHHPLAGITAPQVVDDPLVYWGYLVTNRLHKFMAGELYALSWSLVDWSAKDPAVKGLTKGAEDKQTAKWMKLHPRSNQVRWVSERCWIYDHPRSGTVYAHGFLYPSEATRVKRSMLNHLDEALIDALTSPTNAIGGSTPPTPASWAYSSVSTFGVRYVPPLPELSTKHSVEALVEGSDMSMIREGSPMTPEYAWTHREGRRKRYEGKRVGGTVVVHFIKKNIWYLETALALLEGEEQSEFEKFQTRELEKAALARLPSSPHSHLASRRLSRKLS